jgi:glutamate racemase
MPYGNYSAAGRTDYLRELILKDAVFLLGRRVSAAEPRFDKPPVKAIVIACNTATAYGLEDIREAIAAWKLPVIVVGVVEAGARGVLESKAEGGIGILATVGT